MKVGIIGGSGLEKSDIVEEVEEIEIETPYGKPSSKIKRCKIKDAEVYILSRHGFSHEIPPSQVNNRANIYALAKLNCKYIIATTACGSLREEIKRKDFVVPDQLIDFTKKRETTFHESFENGPQHVSLADPFSEFLREKIIEACKEEKIDVHEKATLITIEGPRFSTRAESNMFRNWGADIINMSVAPEASLAREAGLEYACIAMSTDYDCWKQDEEPVTWQEIERIMRENVENVKKVLLRVIEKLSKEEVSKRDEELIKSKIRTIPNFPKQGIMFRDITTLIQDKEAYNKVLDLFEARYKDKGIDVIAAVESRGFIFAGALASKLNASLVLLRKPGKLPAETISQEYVKEYGEDKIEIHKDDIKAGQKVLLFDDLIATGETALAACQLIEKLGGVVEEAGFVIELADLEGRKKLENRGYKVFSIVRF